METCKVLEQLGYIEQHCYVMSRHFTSFYVMVRELRAAVFPFAFCDLCDRQSDPYFVP